jgi:hypothetical protein
MQGKAWWCVSVILATWDMDIGESQFEGSPLKNKLKEKGLVM